MPVITPATIEIDGVDYTMLPARIETTTLGVEDHGLFTAVLCLDFDSVSGQCTPGCILDDKPDATGRRRGSAYGLDFIMEVLRVVGVDHWERLKGQRVYALKRVDEGWSGLIEGLASISRPDMEYIVFRAHSTAWGLSRS